MIFVIYVDIGVIKIIKDLKAKVPSYEETLEMLACDKKLTKNWTKQSQIMWSQALHFDIHSVIFNFYLLSTTPYSLKSIESCL